MLVWATAGLDVWPRASLNPPRRCSCRPWDTDCDMNTASSNKHIQNGWQQEMPDNWLRSPDPWEIARPNEKVEVSLGCSFELSGGSLRPVPGRPSTLIGIPFDRPVIGYGGSTINTLASLGGGCTRLLQL